MNDGFRIERKVKKDGTEKRKKSSEEKDQSLEGEEQPSKKKKEKEEEENYKHILWPGTYVAERKIELFGFTKNPKIINIGTVLERPARIPDSEEVEEVRRNMSTLVRRAYPAAISEGKTFFMRIFCIIILIRIKVYVHVSIRLCSSSGLLQEKPAIYF